MARSDSEHQSASFMIFYQGEFSSNLRIPTKFATKYRRVVNQASVMLETSDDSEKCWEVKIKNMNGDYYMKDGWSEFMKDNQIHDTDFVTFRLVAQSSFEVTIYRSDGCPRVLTSPTTTSDDVNKSGRGRGSPPTRKRKKRKSNPLYFEICLKNYQNSRICLPKEFTVAASMKEKTDVRVEYKDVRTPNNQNKNWENVVVDHRPDCYRVDLAKGWGRFRKLNKLVYGKVYSFEFKPNQNVIHVKEVK